VNTRNEWSSLCEQFHLPSACVNSGVGLKQIYLRYLDRYEKVHFLGEDGHQADDDDEDSRHRKWSARSLHSVPLTYNHHQHNVTESLRDYNGLSSNLYKSSNYDKLALSLLSPLPNEQDFAINVCTLLSNEGKHTLRLDKYPRLVNILLAHAGVFDSPGTRQLFIEVYSRVRNYSINSFWSDVLDTTNALDLTDERTFMKKPSNCSNTFSRRKTLERERNKREQQQRDSKVSTTSTVTASITTTTTTTTTTAMSITRATIDEELTAPVIEEAKDEIDETLMEIDSTITDCQRLDIDDITIYHDDNNLMDQNQNSIKFEDEDKDLFCMGRTLGTQDPYGQRVLQIASILRNLSFTPENAVILGRNRCFLRFVLLCVRARWSNLHQLGFDILGNIANEIILKDAGDRITNGILSCVSNGVDSSDRFIVISCLEVLNKISQQDSNEEIVTFGLNDNVYDMICRFLALSDIALLVYTLECLYALTSLGERPCTSVARVRGAIDTLVALVTVEAQSYGPKACILMRVVETVSTVSSSATSSTSNNTLNNSTVNSSTTTINTANTTPLITSNSSVVTTSVTSTSTITTTSTQSIATPMANGGSNTPTSISPSPSRPTTPATSLSKAAANKAAEAVASLQQQHAHQQIIQENEQFALGWLRATFEPTTGVKIEQEELYKKYLSYCTKIGRRGVIAPLHFPRCVRSVFGGTIGPNPLKGENTGTQYYEGIKVRATPAPITYPSQNSGLMNVTASAFSSPLSSSSSSSSPSSSSSSSTTISSTTTTSNSTPVKVHPVQQRTVAPINSIPDSTALDNTSKNVVTPASPILKAHLSAPPKQSSNTLQNQPQNTVTKVDSKSQVSVAHPHLSQALLASGSQQQQQQSTNQIANKDSDSRVGATSSSIIKSLLATKVTISGDCMPSAAATCVSTQNACVTNTTSIASSISVNQLITNNQVAQRQQQQRLLQQQLSGIGQPAAPTATPATQLPNIALKAPTNAKSKMITSSVVPVKKVQRLNGAKIIVTNNCDVKTEVNENDTNNQNAAVSTITENHINTNQKICRPPISTTLMNKLTSRSISTPMAEDSDSTNNSLASSSGIGGSRDCSGVGVEEENSLTSFEGILLNGGAPSSIELDAQDDNSSKDSSSLSSKEKPLQSLMLADLLERKVDKELMMNGMLLKNSINDKGIDLMENHIKKVLKESTDIKIKTEINEDNILQAEVTSDDALIEAPRGIKRSLSDSEENGPEKKPKYSNGTTSPEASIDGTTFESALSSIKSEEPDEDKDGEKATVSSTAANLYAALAADCIEDDIDIVDEPIKQECLPLIKEESRFINQTETFNNQQQQQPQQQLQQQPQMQTQQQIQMQPQPQQLIVAAPRQIVVQQAIQTNNQVIIPGQVKRTNTSQPQVLLQQGAGGQLQYVVSGGVPGQNYVLAQSQTALVQGQPQTVLVAQTTQQQGTGAKTIIILQPQSTAQQSTQKVVAMTPQGQQVVVTQVPRPIIQSSALGNIPPPLVPTSAAIPQASIIVNSSIAQTNTNTVTVTIPAVTQQCQNSINSVPSRVITPTPASTPPPTRPTTPHQITVTSHAVAPVAVKQASVKIVKNSNSTSTTFASTENDSKPSTSNQQQQQGTENKTITIKIDPNSYLCEWRGCLKQFKTAHEVYLHVCEAHCPTGPDEILCLWASCDGLKRRRFSLMTHLYDRHCHADSMAIRRKQLTSTGKSEISTSTAPTPPHHPGYAPNAAFHAIKRHALEFVNPKELMQRPSKPAAVIASSSSVRSGQNPPSEQDDNEGPVTKSIRLTAALILRNLVIYSAHGRRHLRAYEPHLAGVALSNVESSRTIAQVLYDMNDQSNSNHR
ncbi:hypothetical protein PV326_005915, partial [Microctonus aethiopoides]